MDRYVVQASCTEMGWVNTRYSSPNLSGAQRLADALLMNSSAWMPGRREVRIMDREGRQVSYQRRLPSPAEDQVMGRVVSSCENGATALPRGARPCR
jgi:hypothetical protein